MVKTGHMKDIFLLGTATHSEHQWKHETTVASMWVQSYLSEIIEHWFFKRISRMNVAELLQKMRIVIEGIWNAEVNKKLTRNVTLVPSLRCFNNLAYKTKKLDDGNPVAKGSFLHHSILLLDWTRTKCDRRTSCFRFIVTVIEKGKGHRSFRLRRHVANF